MKQENLLERLKNSKTFLKSMEALRKLSENPKEKVFVLETDLYKECVKFSKIKHKHSCTKWFHNRPYNEGEYQYSKCNCIADYEERLEQLKVKLKDELNSKFDQIKHRDSCTTFMKNRRAGQSSIYDSICNCDHSERRNKAHDEYLYQLKVARGF